MYEIQQWILTGLTVYLVIVFITLFLFYIRRRGKIRVNILTPIGKIIRWRKPLFEGSKIYILIRKENKRKFIPEWKAEVTQIHDFSKWFGRRGREIYIMPEASKTITFDFQGNGIEQPMWDKKTSTEFINAKVLKREGEGLKPTFPTWILYLNLLLAGITIVIEILNYLKLGRL